MTARLFSRISCYEWLTAVVVVAISIAWAVYAYFHSWFDMDDLRHFAVALDTPLITYLLTPIDIHLVPLHRLVNYAMQRIAPMSFDGALLVMLSAHLGAIYYLYRLLQSLAPDKLNMALVIIYAVNANLLVVLMWWSAGLHRLPYIFLSLACMFHFLEYMNSADRKKLVLSVVFFVLALGFYSKAILIPVYLICLCLAAQLLSPVANFKNSMMAALVLLSVAFLYTLWLIFVINADQARVSTDLGKIWAVWSRGMMVSAQALLPTPLALSSYGPELASAAWMFAFALTSWRRPQIAGLWALGLICIASNILLIAASGRAARFGVFAAIEPRYFLEVVFLQIIFLGLIVHRVWRGRATPSFLASGSWGKPLLLVCLLAYAAWSVHKSLNQVSGQGMGERHYLSSVFGRNLDAELSNYESLSDLNVHEDTLPSFFFTFGIYRNSMPLSKVLALYGRGTPTLDSPDRPIFMVTEEGKLAPYEGE